MSLKQTVMSSSSAGSEERLSLATISMDRGAPSTDDSRAGGRSYQSTNR
jgi:hypothetical protein